MMEGLRSWLMGVISVSVLCAAADSLMPDGGVKKVGKLVCALAVLFVILQPLATLRGMDLTELLTQYAGTIREEESSLQEQAQYTQKAVIEEHCAAYISDKAAQFGAVCRVEVECEFSDDGLYLPRSARLWGDFSDVVQSRLTQFLQQELGIPTEKQTYYHAKEESP